VRADPRQAPVPGERNDLGDVSGVRVGHYHRIGDGWLTGTTVILPPEGTVGGVDVRGGGPSTRETDALAPTTLTEAVHAVCLSGGSSYGLAAASGVMDLLGQRGIGLRVGAAPGAVVPIVPAACLFDLRDGEAFSRRPDASFGRAAAEAALRPPRAAPSTSGNVGAGAGAHAGSLKGGLGTASAVLGDGTVVAALVAVNSSGEAADPATGVLYGARYLLPGELAGDFPAAPGGDFPAAPGGDFPAAPGGQFPAAPDGRAGGPGGAPSPGEGGGRDGGPGGVSPRNTMLAVVVTDAALDAAACCRVAMAAHDGLARAVRPAHGLTDGDVVFALATRRRPLAADPPHGLAQAGTGHVLATNAVMAASADAVTRAIVHAVLGAQSAGGMRCYRDVFPGALPS